MKDSNLYYPLWLKYSPVFVMLLKKALKGTETISLNKNDFETLGDRKISDYTFNLEIKNTKVVNGIRHTAVARDLYDVLITNTKTKELLQNRHYKLSLGKEFILRILVVE